jgi:Escherichia/Staphylococcus phage prohead protease
MNRDIEKRTYFFQNARSREAARSSNSAGTIEGYAALFNTLSVELGGFREQIARGAFSDSIQRDDIRLLLNHNADLLLGRNTSGTLSLREDSRGLAIRADLPTTTLAQDLIVLLDRRDITQMSFAFVVLLDRWAMVNDEPQRTLLKVRLFDASIVSFPAYKETSVGVSSQEGDWDWRHEHELKRRKLDLLSLSL